MSARDGLRVNMTVETAEREDNIPTKLTIPS